MEQYRDNNSKDQEEDNKCDEDGDNSQDQEEEKKSDEGDIFSEENSVLVAQNGLFSPGILYPSDLSDFGAYADMSNLPGANSTRLTEDDFTVFSKKMVKVTFVAGGDKIKDLPKKRKAVQRKFCKNKKFKLDK